MAGPVSGSSGAATSSYDNSAVSSGSHDTSGLGHSPADTGSPLAADGLHSHSPPHSSAQTRTQGEALANQPTAEDMLRSQQTPASHLQPTSSTIEPTGTIRPYQGLGASLQGLYGAWKADTVTTRQALGMIPDMVQFDAGAKADQVVEAVRESQGIDPVGEFVANVREVIANPPAGVSNDAIINMPSQMPEVFRDLAQQPVGTTINGDHQHDGFVDNSFEYVRVPEGTLQDNFTDDFTFHQYDTLTNLGKVGGTITRDFVLNEGLLERFSLPSETFTPTPANFTGPSDAYAVKVPTEATLSDPANYTSKIGVVEQARVPGGVVNITTVDHAVYRGTIRRTVIEHEGNLFIHTHGIGINRAWNSGDPQMSPDIVNLGRGVVYGVAAYSNDSAGAKAFETLDQQLVGFIEAERAK